MQKLGKKKEFCDELVFFELEKIYVQPRDRRVAGGQETILVVSDLAALPRELVTSSADITC